MGVLMTNGLDVTWLGCIWTASEATGLLPPVIVVLPLDAGEEKSYTITLTSRVDFTGGVSIVTTPSMAFEPVMLLPLRLIESFGCVMDRLADVLFVPSAVAVIRQLVGVLIAGVRNVNGFEMYAFGGITICGVS